jgi:hypothetical protein
VVTFHARETLGLGAPVPSRLAARTDTDYGAGHEGLTYHHVGDGGTLYKPNQIDRLRGIWTYHVRTLGYGDIAYNGAFDADGQTYGLRDSRYVSAHAASTGNEANRLTDGIVFLEDARGLTHDALTAFSWWVDLYRWVRHRTPQLYAHRYWGAGHGGQPTACPGDQLDKVVGFVGGHA